MHTLQSVLIEHFNSECLEGFMISPRYAAGFFDGEGCVNYRCLHRSESRIPQHKRKRRNQGTDYFEWVVQLCVSNTNLDVLLALQDMYQGSVNTHVANERNCKDIHQWRVMARQAEYFAKSILRYAIVKKRHLELFLEFRATIGVPGRKGLDSKVHKRRLEIGAEIISLNARGRDPVRKTLVVREHHLRPNPDLLVSPTCIVEGCDRATRALDLCNRHYLKQYREQNGQQNAATAQPTHSASPFSTI